MKKIVVLIFMLLLILTTFSGCRSEEEREMMIPLEKIVYAVAMRFEFQIIVDGEVSNSETVVTNHVVPNFPNFTDFYTDLVFVHSEAEAAEFPDNVIVAWPSERTVGMLRGFQWAIGRNEENLMFNERQQREVINLIDFGFHAPITVEDIVDNWEQVNALWRSFTSSEQSTIRNW